MPQITNDQYMALRKAIYDLLMENPEMGMGEMGECELAARELVDTWIEQNNISLI